MFFHLILKHPGDTGRQVGVTVPIIQRHKVPKLFLPCAKHCAKDLCIISFKAQINSMRYILFALHLF